MSKINLERILGQVEQKIDEQRSLFNLELHKYSVNYEQIVSQVYNQIHGKTTKIDIPRDILGPPVEKYCLTVFNNFKRYKTTAKNFSVRVLGNHKSFIAIIENDSSSRSNVFAAVFDRRRKALATLKEEIYDVVRDFLKTKRKYSKQQRLLYNRIHGFEGKDGVTRRGLLEVGHLAGNSIVEQELYEPKIQFANELRRLQPQNSKLVTKVLADSQFEVITNPKIAGRLRSGKIVLSVYDQGRENNSAQSNVEQQMRARFIKAIKSVLDKTDFIGLESSPNVYDILEGKFHKTAREAGFTGTKNDRIKRAETTYKSSATRQLKTKLLTTTINDNFSNFIKGAEFQPIAEPTTNWYSMIAIVNAKLHDTLRKNMQSPRLNYKTGRFARSVKITGVTLTERGYPSFIYDYQRDPYDVFDRTLGAQPWNTPERNPSDLINMSIREIMRDMAINRFYLRRA